ncbi:MAG: 3-oxoacyl-[acyl-carrier-protein] reductase [Deltaproteobacteria bacterium]|nr:3-oxoacyl-[acyl-carrier-protein] reductase [Deltaproteobacteria bacterium]
MLFKDRVAIVTGGGQGIGKAISLKLAGEGADVAVVDINPELSGQAAKEIEALGRRAIALKADVGDFNGAEKMVGDVLAGLGGLHILINNAGITRDRLLLRMTEEDWDIVLNVNLKGAFNCTKAAVRVMSKNRYGRIVNVASIVGLTGNPGQANYSASKAGLIGFTKTVAREFAGRNITCNAVAPGFIDTAMTKSMPEAYREALTSRIPIERLGTPGDVAEGVSFLASDRAGYITGHVLSINGGMFM